MGKRYDTKKISNTPSLKRRIARFCAEVEATYCSPNYIEMLFKGHRGFISFSEDDLAKEFDKRLQILRDKYSKERAVDEEGKRQFKWHSQSNSFMELELWYEEGISIANEVFEEQFLK